MGRDLGQCHLSNLVWRCCRKCMAGRHTTPLGVQSSKSSARHVASAHSPLTPLPSLLDPPSPCPLEGIFSRLCCTQPVFHHRLDGRIRWVGLRRIPRRRCVDLGQHVVVAVSPPAFQIGVVAHHWGEHRCSCGLNPHLRIDQLITTCRTLLRSGNHLIGHHRNTTSTHHRFLRLN